MDAKIENSEGALAVDRRREGRREEGGREGGETTASLAYDKLRDCE